jgi:fermentation-respiration switch protein FrsA (DUF1100 family)
MQMRRMPLLLLLVSCSTGCTHLLFYPDRDMRLRPDRLGLSYEDVALTASDGTKLHAWLLPARADARGVVLFLHGNAQNISTHISSVAWLPSEGYHVLLLDYRGYGRSEGEPGLSGALSDADAAFHWLTRQPRFKDEPLFLLGQSLGASLAAYYAGSRADVRERLSALVLDAPFASYRRLAREKLGAFWLTWLLQYPLSLLMPDAYSPIRNAAELAPLPLLVICSENDEIVPTRHCLDSFDAASQPKQLLLTRGPHIATFLVHANRRRLLAFLEQARIRARREAPPNGFVAPMGGVLPAGKGGAGPTWPLPQFLRVMESMSPCPSFRHGFMPRYAARHPAGECKSAPDGFVPDKSARQPICACSARRVQYRDISHESGSQGWQR